MTLSPSAHPRVTFPLTLARVLASVLYGDASAVRGRIPTSVRTITRWGDP